MIFFRRRSIRFVSRTLLFVMAYELVWPVCSFALTTGPSQPEVQSFEPVGTTDMVDMFTGDFVYNIPLMDVEGYPINISYHGGINMEQEASWVGLGWNINPGAINRTVRGMPDDFKGEEIVKSLSIADEENFRGAIAAGAEVFGTSTPLINFSASLGGAVNLNSYRGLSVDLTASAGVNVFGMASAGINFGVGSESGADIDYNAGVSFGSSSVVNSQISAGVGFSMGHGYNTRTGLKDRSFSVSTSVNMGGRGFRGPSFSTSVPIGVKNIIPVITNATTMRSVHGMLKGGVEAAWTFGYGEAAGMYSKISYEKNGTRQGYGYLYAHRAENDDVIHDFTRDRDGMFNRTMHFLPLGNMTYDIYSVSGQGTGGSFRPFRNDFGSVFDPVVTSSSEASSFAADGGAGWTAEFGTDISSSITKITSGPWGAYKRPFTGPDKGTIYEAAYFKQAGELTGNSTEMMQTVGGLSATTFNKLGNLPQVRPGSARKRESRSNFIYYFTAEEADRQGVPFSGQLYSYNSSNGFAAGPDVAKEPLPRISNTRRAHSISEIAQVQTDGTRYIYGIAAMNNVQREATFAIEPPLLEADIVKGLVPFSPADDSENNENGLDNYHSATITPSFAHSYLLTSVLSPDFVDVKGDGPTDDDFGTYTRFNYSLKNPDYRWRAPMTGGADYAQHDPGFYSDVKDDKASYLVGSREQWILHSIETKNFVAEFYTTGREDGRGWGKGIPGVSGGFENNPVQPGVSYKLDSIVLYNKHDRFINKTQAVPVKTVIFKYHAPTSTLALCRGIPNANDVSGQTGKLTLERIYTRYGNSYKSMMSPYRFEYSSVNPGYDPAAKDRWGGYKVNDPEHPNHEFPFVKQSDPDLDAHAGAWSLRKIHLPSGGNIEVDYEADDYAYVQDKRAMEMFRIKGIGMGPSFTPMNRLYMNPMMGNNYLYFERYKDRELPGVSFRDNYLQGEKLLYFNFRVHLTGRSDEPVKGYAEVMDIGAIDDHTGYIRLKPVVSAGVGMLNPITYTALNFGRYNLPHIMYNDGAFKGDMDRILKQLKSAIKEMMQFGKNPLAQFLKKDKGCIVDLDKSYVRLHSPGMKKKGGGHRVKELRFRDNWDGMTQQMDHVAVYGKRYDYTTTTPAGHVISSGVASYEPQIGGDENPHRMPVPYTAQSGSKWPPNDPVNLYQEMPLGESLYPDPVVGYSKVRVSSIHNETGRSSQAVDVYEFYTAQDFPVRVDHTPIEQEQSNGRKFTFKKQSEKFAASQGFSLIFNNMHGKPKKTERGVMLDGRYVTRSYQLYRYKASGKKLENTVAVLEYDPAEGTMRKVFRQMGVEADVTIDTRQKREETKTDNFYLNVNTTMVAVFPIPLPLPMPWTGEYLNEFQSLVVTKIIQQYGVLESVESFRENAKTVMTNEVFDPETGSALITSLTNEYGDREYSVSYPGYWGYKNMGPAYANTGFEMNIRGDARVRGYVGELQAGDMISHFRIGDELEISYRYNGNAYRNNVWVAGFGVLDTVLPGFNPPPPHPMTHPNPLARPPSLDTVDVVVSDDRPCRVLIKPRYKYHASWPDNGSLQDVQVKIVRSGARNMLGEELQSYTTLADPFDGHLLREDTIRKLVRIAAREYSDAHTQVIPRYLTGDSINEFLNGRKMLHRLYREYTYHTKRTYPASNLRMAGLFDAPLLWRVNDGIRPYIEWFEYNSACGCNSIVHRFKVSTTPCSHASSSLFASFFTAVPNAYKEWIPARTVTKWSPWGGELENVDAAGNFSAAVYGYNHGLPVMVAQNARQYEVFNEGFEAYGLLRMKDNLVHFDYSPFSDILPLQVAGNEYDKYQTGTGLYRLTKDIAHTGRYSIRIFDAILHLTLPAAPFNPATPFARDEAYRRPSVEPGRKYILSYWYRPVTPTGRETSYSVPAGMIARSNIIEGWQQMEMEFTAAGNDVIEFPTGCYLDDIRIVPAEANAKGFVYNPFTQKLVATLDENNFATFYEYDQEGSLVRTKRETEHGIITLSESRSGKQSGN